MKWKLCAIVLAGCLLLAPLAAEAADAAQPRDEKPKQQQEISSEDRKVIQNLDLLALMDLLKDMDILEAAKTAVPEEKK